jgi:two-component system NarL family sensor kinase
MPLAAQLAREVADVATELHDIAHQLRPSYLHGIPLNMAIERRCDMLGRRGVPIDCLCSGDFADLPHDVSDNLYRISQEALANAARHADAGRISVRLVRAENVLRLSVVDDGCGISEHQRVNPGLGLRIMQERAALVGAAIEISSSPSGTMILVTLERI